MLGKITHTVLRFACYMSLFCFCAFFLTSCSTIYNVITSILSIPFRVLNSVL